MTTTHLFFFFRHLSNMPIPAAFKGYTTVPTVLAFMRNLSPADVPPPVEGQAFIYNRFRRIRGR